MTSKTDPRRRVRVPQICVVLLLGVLGALSWLVWNYHHTVVWVEHSVAVKSSISLASDLVLESESATRGFLLTGDPVYRSEYRQSAEKYGPVLEDLRRLTQDNPQQQSNLDALQPAMDGYFAHRKEIIAFREGSTLENTLSNLKTLLPGTQTKKVRDSLASMQKEEDRLLALRVTDVTGATLAIAAVSLLGLILIVTALFTWIIFERRHDREMLVRDAQREQREAQIRQMHKIDAVGQLTGGLAHDLNNMLAVIMSGLNLCQKRLARGDVKIERFLDGAMDGATRAATLTSRLMAFAKQLPLNPKRIDVNRLVSSMEELLQRTLGETIVTEIVLTGGIWPSSADVSQLENAILNLAINARDAMPGGGRLTIETANCDFDSRYSRHNDIPEGHYVQIAVTDTGAGMTADVIAKAFDPFFTTKGVGKGTGLGLSQVYGFIKQTGGNIKIYSEPGHGTTVKMYLPRLHDAGPVQEAKTARAEAWPDLHGDHSDQLILVVEDDARVNEMTVSSLRELGYAVIHSNSAKSALEQLDAHPATAMLLTDIVMPDVNGRQLAAEALRRAPDLKVLYTTGFTRNAIIHNGRLDAGLHFIAKPFTLVQLATKIDEVLAS
jgi:signal transduction histidine kinase